MGMEATLMDVRMVAVVLMVVVVVMMMMIPKMLTKVLTSKRSQKSGG